MLRTLLIFNRFVILSLLKMDDLLFFRVSRTLAKNAGQSASLPERGIGHFVPEDLIGDLVTRNELRS